VGAAAAIAVVATLSSAGVRAASPVLIRDPYLTDVAGSWAMVSFATDTKTPSPVVEWGPASGDCSAPPSSVTATYVTSFTDALGATVRMFKAQLTGLQSNTAYCYRVYQAGVDLLGAAPVFTSALAAGVSDPFSFAVIGDWGGGTVDESKVLGQIAAADPSFLVTTGDNVYNSGTQKEYGDLSGGNAFAPQYWPQIGRTIPAVAVEGNHGFSGSIPYFQNWPEDGTVAACAAAGCRYQVDTYCCVGSLGTTTKSYPSSWFAFDWGASRFYVLEGAWSDSTGAYQGDFQAHFNGPVAGCSFCGEELTWLQNDLATHPAAHRFAFWHYPLYSDSTSQPSDTYLDGPGALEGVLASYGVNIIFNGHAHQYERNLPQIAGSPMLSYVTGGGGDPLGGVSVRGAFDAYAKAVYHFLLVTVSGTSVQVKPIDENGASFDVQNYSFAGSAPADDFSLSASPSSATVTPGGSASFSVSTSVSSGAAQTVTLSASGLPAGVSAAFNPVSVTAGGTSALTLTTSASTPGGSYVVTVTGTGTTATHTTTVTLVVSPPDDFAISVSPQSVSVTQGGAASANVTTAVSSGAAQTVTLSASGLPAGVSAAFNPVSVTAGGTSALTLTTSASTPAGGYTVTVIGTGTTATHTASLGLTVTGPSGGVRLVQAVGATESVSATTLTATLSTPTVTGDLLVLTASVYAGATNQIASVTDSAGNAWTKIGSYYTSGHFSDGELWYSAGARSATSVTVAVASAAVMAVEVQEFAGVASTNPLDGVSGASNTGASADSGVLQPSSATDLVVGFVAGHASTQQINVTAGGFTAQPQQTSTNGTSTPATLVAVYAVPGAASSQDLTAAFGGSMYWAAGVVLFKAA
jgi:Calcineurin-like phosphoesterase/Purple acid Phosphatase, N-terminal domain